MRICFHHDDWDGVAAAWALRTAFHDEKISFYPVNYGDDLPAVFSPGTHIWFVDFCPPPIVLESICRLVKDGAVTVIDHHKSSEKDCLAYFEIHEQPSNLHLEFDTTLSGCVLTWNCMFADDAREAPLLLRYVGDRDMWEFKLHASREINAWLASWPQTIDSFHDRHLTIEAALATTINLDDNNEVALREFVERGAACLRSDQRFFEKVATRADKITLDGWNGLAVNTSYRVSEVCNYLLTTLEYADFAFAMAYQIDRGVVRVSLRSRKGSEVDVSTMAKKRGGGGHKHAAGYEIPLALTFR